MFRPFASFVERLDFLYRERPYFSRLKARLLAAFLLLLFVFVPLNILKLVWVGPPQLPLRIELNLVIGAFSLLALRWLRQGRLELAGSALVLGAILPAHGLVLLAPGYDEPLGVAVQLFILDYVFLLLALVFASRRAALVALATVVAGDVLFHSHALAQEPVAGSLRFAADTLLRDGLIAIVFVFGVGLALMRLIEAAHSRSEEAIRATQALNENLERLVSARTRELEIATRLANEVARAKGDFLANMSHEIRTPLNGIIGLAELLGRRKDLPPDSAEQLRLIAESGDLLLRLLSDILDFSKIEAGQMVLEARSFALAPLVEDSIALVAPKARLSGIRLGSTLAPGLPRHWEGDSFRLRQVLLNLLANAIKFTPAGGTVQLAASLAEPVSDPPWLRLEVRDTGIGMDAAMVARLFERFTQADTSTTRRYGGTGLGLAISARLVALMGGRLEAESSPGQGSVFYFAVPLCPAAAAADPAPGPDDIAAPLGLRVLVAEDNGINQKIITAQLAQLGCSWTMAADGEEALAALRREPRPDVVLMDCHMPRLDGWEAARRLRGWAGDPEADEAQRQAAALPIIALSAAALPEEQARCRAVGMNGFVAKPVKLAELRRALLPYVRSPAA